MERGSDQPKGRGHASSKPATTYLELRKFQAAVAASIEASAYKFLQRFCPAFRMFCWLSAQGVVSGAGSACRALSVTSWPLRRQAPTRQAGSRRRRAMSEPDSKHRAPTTSRRARGAEITDDDWAPGHVKCEDCDIRNGRPTTPSELPVRPQRRGRLLSAPTLSGARPRAARTRRARPARPARAHPTRAVPATRPQSPYVARKRPPWRAH
jgi:hypothetical protein